MIIRIAFHTGNKIYSLLVPPVEHVKIKIPAIYRNDRSGLKRQFLGNTDLMSLSVSHVCPAGKIPLMVQL
jgi:hypothetical protein